LMAAFVPCNTNFSTAATSFQPIMSNNHMNPYPILNYIHLLESAIICAVQRTIQETLTIKTCITTCNINLWYTISKHYTLKLAPEVKDMLTTGTLCRCAWAEPFQCSSFWLQLGSFFISRKSSFSICVCLSTNSNSCTKIFGIQIKIKHPQSCFSVNINYLLYGGVSYSVNKANSTLWEGE
jgi:hypothetical protein